MSTRKRALAISHSGSWDEEDGNVGWESPWGRGRPGWHIDAVRWLLAAGSRIDIHCGGLINIPHHEAEIAQSESAPDNGLSLLVTQRDLLVEVKKMSNR